MPTTPSRVPLRVGYALVTTGFDAEADRVALAGCDEVHVDVVPDLGDTSQPSLRTALTSVRAGDTLAVTALRRLAPTFARLAPILLELRQADVSLTIGAAVYPLSGPTGRTFVEGLRLATDLRVPLPVARDRNPGRRQALTPEQLSAARLLAAAGHFNVVQLADLFGVHHSTMSRRLREDDPKGAES